MAKIEKLGVQLFTVRDYMNGEDAIKSTFEKLKSIGYDEVQTAGCPIPFDQMGKLCREAGLSVCGTHDDFGMMINDTEKAIALHDELGTKIMGTGGFWSEEKEEVLKYVDNVNALAKKIAPRGYKFSYHNHSHEFRRFDENHTMLEYFAENFDPDGVTFCLDTYWVQNGGGDVRHWIEKLAGRIEILHLKDMAMRENSCITEIGNGNLYWDGIIDTAVKTGVKHFVVEHDVNWIDNDPFKSLEVSANYIRNKFM